ncbi:MAG: GAF domain-containing protein [Rhodospirillales bacterium]
MSQDLPAELARILAEHADQQGAAGLSYARALDAVAGAFAAPTATLHVIDAASDPLRPDLIAVADRGLPEAVRVHTRRIPYGRGMAGICAERRQPVTVCNLQTDASGVVRPGARETGVAGAIVVPLFAPSNDRLIGTLGIGKTGEHTYTEGEQQLLAACGAVLAEALAAALATGRPLPVDGG